jgi:hypothetical protein
MIKQFILFLIVLLVVSQAEASHSERVTKKEAQFLSELILDTSQREEVKQSLLNEFMKLKDFKTVRKIKIKTLLTIIKDKQENDSFRLLALSLLEQIGDSSLIPSLLKIKEESDNVVIKASLMCSIDKLKSGATGKNDDLSDGCLNSWDNAILE